jgi:hypothetical protein
VRTQLLDKVASIDLKNTLLMVVVIERRHWSNDGPMMLDSIIECQLAHGSSGLPHWAQLRDTATLVLPNWPGTTCDVNWEGQHSSGWGPKWDGTPTITLCSSPSNRGSIRCM